LAPVKLYSHLNFTDDRGREKIVMVPAMFDSNTDPTATTAVQELSRVSQPQVLIRAHNFLAFQCHNSHLQGTREFDRARLIQISGCVSGLQEGTVNSPSFIEREAVEQNRTKLPFIWSAFIPDKSDIEKNPVNFLKIKNPYAKAMPIFFPHGNGDFDCDSRGVEVSETEFVNHYLRYARKQLVEFTPFVFHSLYRIDTFRARASILAPRGYPVQGNANNVAAGNPGSKFQLSKLTGSSSYYSKIHQDLQNKCTYLGYPEFFYTFSNSDQWDITLATALSQDGYDVWHVKDEARLLGGPEQEAYGSPYVVHLRSSLDQNCPFHSSKYTKHNKFNIFIDILHRLPPSSCT
jgi:hypothetical protein